MQLPKCSTSTPTSGPLPTFLQCGRPSSLVTQAAFAHPLRLKRHCGLNTCPGFPAGGSSSSLCSRGTWNPVSSKGAFANTQGDSLASPSLLWLRLTLPPGVTSSKGHLLRGSPPPGCRGALPAELGDLPGFLQPSGSPQLICMPHHPTASINEAGLPVRLGATVGNELGLGATVGKELGLSPWTPYAEKPRSVVC